MYDDKSIKRFLPRPRPPSSPSYTLAELEVLSSEFLESKPVDRFREDARDLTPELLISNLLTWLAKREKEVGDER